MSMHCFYLQVNNQRLTNAIIKYNKAKFRTTVRFVQYIIIYKTSMKKFNSIINSFTILRWEILMLIELK